jgi:hypothetical protein
VSKVIQEFKVRRESVLKGLLGLWEPQALWGKRVPRGILVLLDKQASKEALEYRVRLAFKDLLEYREILVFREPRVS